MKSRREKILDTAEDLVWHFLTGDRKEDEELGRGEIEEAIHSGEVSIGEIVARFTVTLSNSVRG